MSLHLGLFFDPEDGGVKTTAVKTSNPAIQNTFDLSLSYTVPKSYALADVLKLRDNRK
jgi:hypothetical protein